MMRRCEEIASLGLPAKFWRGLDTPDEHGLLDHRSQPRLQSAGQ